MTTQRPDGSSSVDGTGLTPDQARQVLETAGRAPSVHNTQPWRFRTDGDVVEVHADRGRALAEQDPEGRELLVSCGAAAMQAALGLRGLGRAATLTWLPDLAAPELVARLVAGTEQPVSDDDSRLLAAVPLRHTDRSAFDPAPVPDELVQQLRQGAEAEGCWLTAPSRPEDVVELEVLASRADRLLRQDAALGKEMSGWVRPGDRPAEGVPAAALPGHGAGRGSSLTLRDFDPGAPAGAPPDAAAAPGAAPDPDAAQAADDPEPPVAERPLLLLLGTPGDSPLEWLQAGAGLARVLLTATAAGLVANPQTALLEVPALRQQLAGRLGLLGRPQMLLRVGWPGGAGSPQTGRRRVEELVTPATAPVGDPSAAGRGG